MGNIATKVCSKCGKDKPLDEFENNSGCKDGYTRQCKICRKEKKKITDKIYNASGRRSENKPSRAKRKYNKTGKYAKKKVSIPGVSEHDIDSKDMGLADPAQKGGDVISITRHNQAVNKLNEIHYLITEKLKKKIEAIKAAKTIYKDKIVEVDKPFEVDLSDEQKEELGTGHILENYDVRIVLKKKNSHELVRDMDKGSYKKEGDE